LSIGAPGEIRTPDRLVRGLDGYYKLLINKVRKTAFVAISPHRAQQCTTDVGNLWNIRCSQHTQHRVSINNTFYKFVDQCTTNNYFSTMMFVEGDAMAHSTFLALLCALAVASCAAKPLLPGSHDVVLSKESAPAGCQLVGEVQGSQGNFWTAEFTSDANLVNGARNEVRNAASAIQANYVKIETESFSHNTGEDSLGGTYSVIVIGNAYRCREESLVSG